MERTGKEMGMGKNVISTTAQSAAAATEGWGGERIKPLCMGKTGKKRGRKEWEKALRDVRHPASLRAAEADAEKRGTRS
jgi:hypothetical protein